jgi:SAM-dependent methyltransferase
MVERCPLCGIRDAALIKRVAYTEIFGSLERVWSITVPVSVAARHTPSAFAELVRCSECQLDYFAGAVPADGDLYSLLTSSGNLRYEGNRWEHRIVRHLVGRADTVVDFGAGLGHFLRRLRDRVERAVGVDYNPEAAATMRSAGIEAHTVTFRDFAASNRASFTTATAFHLIEHVPDVAELVESAHTVLKPGGRFFVSTPHRDRTVRDILEPLDFPPHHVSHWSPAQFERLAQQFGFDLEVVEVEPASEAAVLELTRFAEGFRPVAARATRAIVRRSGLAAGLAARQHVEAIGPVMLAHLVRR